MDVLTALPAAPAAVGPWSGLVDEQLVALARPPGAAGALDELLRRCGPANAQLVRRLATRSGLQDADRMDAQQEAVFWALEAVRNYRPGPSPAAPGCRFRTFMYRVVTVRFIDYCRRLRRERQVGHPSVAADGAAAADGPELTDLRTCVDRELDRLGPGARFLWGLLAGGVSLRQAAVELGISYDAAKRRRRQLLARLRFALDG